MKMCQPHWDAIRARIKTLGIDHLVAKDGEGAFKNTLSELQGEEAQYDPLMDCHWMVTNMALQMGGLYLLTQKEDGTEYCPICEAVENGQEEREWIEGPTNASYKHCIELGLIQTQ